MLEDSLTVNLDANISEYSGNYLMMGTEYSIIDAVQVRMGYKFDRKRESKSRLNVGLGAGKGYYRIDYTYTPFENLGQAQRLSLSVKFGRSKKKEYVKAKRNDKNVRKKEEDNINAMIEKIQEEIKSGNENVVIELSESYIKYKEIFISIKEKPDVVYDRIADIMQVMPEYRIKITDPTVAKSIKEYFLNRKIADSRIICRYASFP
jgi:hypothetical protein